MYNLDGKWSVNKDLFFVDVHVQIDRKLCQTTYQVANAVDVQTEHVATTYTDRYMMGPEQDWSGKNDADILAAASRFFCA